MGAARMKPRASMPTTRSTVSPENSSARASTTKRKASTSPNSGVASRKTIPGSGKSGTSCTSSVSHAASVIHQVYGRPPTVLGGPAGLNGASWPCGGGEGGRSRRAGAGAAGGARLDLPASGGGQGGQGVAGVGEAGLALLQPRHDRGGHEQRGVGTRGQADEQGEGELLERLRPEQQG